MILYQASYNPPDRNPDLFTSILLKSITYFLMSCGLMAHPWLPTPPEGGGAWGGMPPEGVGAAMLPRPLVVHDLVMADPDFMADPELPAVLPRKPEPPPKPENCTSNKAEP